MEMTTYKMHWYLKDIMALYRQTFFLSFSSFHGQTRIFRSYELLLLCPQSLETLSVRNAYRTTFPGTEECRLLGCYAVWLS
jgi:hypothetical protein